MAMDNHHNSQRYPELDVFRGLAILAVVLFHYTTRYDQIYGHGHMTFAFPAGKFGVQFFFILSGFVISMAIEKSKTSRDFLINRFSRLFPAYWCAVAITFSLVALFGLPGREVSLSAALLNLTMAQDWLAVPAVDGAYWTLSRFVSFYLIMLVVKRLELDKKMGGVCLAWLVVICAAKAAALRGLTVPVIMEITLLLKDGGLFVLGIMFFMVKKQGYQPATIINLILCLCTIAFVDGPLSGLYALLFATLFILLLGNQLHFVNLKPLIFLGNISYSLYLLHQNIGYIIIRELHKLELNYLLIILIPSAISLLLATAVTYYIEKPVLTYWRRLSS